MLFTVGEPAKELSCSCTLPKFRQKATDIILLIIRHLF